MNQTQYHKQNSEVAKSLKIAHREYSEIFAIGRKVVKKNENEVGTVDRIELTFGGTMVGVQFNNRYAIYHAHEIMVKA